jgi:starch synthase
MRILVLLSNFFTSGLTTHVVSLCESLRQCGQEVYLVITHPTHGAAAMRSYLNYLSDLGIHTTVIQAKRLNELARFCKRNHIDVVHGHSSWDFSVAHAIYINYGIPYVLTCHSLGLENKRYQRFLEQAACIICVGPRIMASVAEYGSRVTLLQNAVDLNRFKPSAKAEVFTVTYAGRSDRNKQPGIKALGTAIDTFPHPIRFIVAGNAACAKQIGKNSQYVGWEPRMERYMNSSDVVVGTGRAIREGMAAGNACIVLGWNYEGVVTPEELVDIKFPDFSGRLGKKELTVTALQNVLLSLYENRDWLMELQKFGRSYAEQHFDLHQSTLRTIEIYQEASS